MKRNRLILAGIVLIAIGIASAAYSTHHHAKSPQNGSSTVQTDEDSSSAAPTVSNSASDTPAPAAAISTGCDESLWTHVYNPTRLTVITKCVTVTGKVTESSTNTDGDAHFQLQLDSAYSSMINDVNTSDKNGDLVVEAVCAVTPSDPKVGNACHGYHSSVTLPSVGDTVKVTGAFVDDTHNGWNEIHPVTSITKL